MNATAKIGSIDATLVKQVADAPAFIVLDRDRIAVRTGVCIGDVAYSFDTEIAIHVPLVAGRDYFIAAIADAGLAVLSADHLQMEGPAYRVIGGFHFAPGGNAVARAGGDDVPAINPHSIWDSRYLPACEDPRGMACVELAGGKRFWCDIYLLNADPFRHGTSAHNQVIADGDDVPTRGDDDVYDALDWETSKTILAAFGKQLLGPEEFFAAALGVTEGASLGRDPKRTGLDAVRTSKWGIMQATGNMSTWGLDGDPDGPRQAWLFGGRWGYGGFAGSRCAGVVNWPDSSNGWLGARGRSDHLQLA